MNNNIKRGVRKKCIAKSENVGSTKMKKNNNINKQKKNKIFVELEVGKNSFDKL